MNEERYTEIQTAADYLSFTFVSRGRHGDLTKIVRFDKLQSRGNTYNLALGTLLPDNSFDYESTTNNGDRNKLLATVAIIVYVFMEEYTGYDVYITGSDYRRTLLYQRAINYGYPELIETFNIYGKLNNASQGEFEPYDKGKYCYSGFLIEKK